MLDKPASTVTDPLLYGLTLLLALAFPFEIIYPFISFSWFDFTNLELLVNATAVTWTLHLLFLFIEQYRRSASRPSLSQVSRLFGTLGLVGKTVRRNFSNGAPLFRPALLFLLIAIVSALLAPIYPFEALKFTSRFVIGLYVMALTIQVANRPARQAGLLWAIIIGAGLSSLLGLAEWFGWSWAAPILALFKIGASRVGGDLRVSASFQYATIAAMFFEMVVPLALVMAATAVSRLARIIALSTAVLGTLLVVLSLTRSGMITLTLLFSAGAILGLVRPQFRPLWRPIAWCALSLTLAMGWLMTGSSSFLTRLTTENDTNWYNATYAAPPLLILQPRESATVAIDIQNNGRATWEIRGRQSYAFGYHWFDATGQEIAGESHIEIDLPHNVAPGEQIRLVAPIQAPSELGDYYVSWGMLHRHVLWFRHRGVPEAKTLIRVNAATDLATPPPSPPPALFDDSDPASRAVLPITVPRRDLWWAAGQMLVERPLLGHGPDNFRRLYGRYLEMEQWDERIFANNLYLELLATVGMIGTAAFGWLLLATIQLLWPTFKQPWLPFKQPWLPFNRPHEGQIGLWLAGLAGSLAAFLIHGLFDYFLGFAAVSLLFWMVLGLIAALSAKQRPDWHGRSNE